MENKELIEKLREKSIALQDFCEGHNVSILGFMALPECRWGNSISFGNPSDLAIVISTSIDKIPEIGEVLNLASEMDWKKNRGNASERISSIRDLFTYIYGPEIMQRGDVDDYLDKALRNAERHLEQPSEPAAQPPQIVTSQYVDGTYVVLPTKP